MLNDLFAFFCGDFLGYNIETSYCIDGCCQNYHGYSDTIFSFGLISEDGQVEQNIKIQVSGFFNPKVIINIKGKFSDRSIELNSNDLKVAHDGSLHIAKKNGNSEFYTILHKVYA
ncbi:hypothetical protein [Wolbachia endosymbiont of Pentidionis agamae]|uniref:hypothetical protein n=1 Tax=Wolbachia endosymbiont of Pentidionis agamae TaxID=3110435 RepID=UPI002FD31DDB